jgi:hypothetical protein
MATVFHRNDYHCGLLRTHCTSYDPVYAICQDTCQRKVERLECCREPDFDSQVNSVNGVHDLVVHYTCPEKGIVYCQ